MQVLNTVEQKHVAGGTSEPVINIGTKDDPFYIPANGAYPKLPYSILRKFLEARGDKSAM